VVEQSLTGNIRVVYPSKEFKAKQMELIITQSDLFAEAQEHYLFINTIIAEDLHGYKQWQRATLALKRKTLLACSKHENWKTIVNLVN
jgi:hypothetical protein